MARAAPGSNSRSGHPIWKHDEAVSELARLTAILFSIELRNHSGQGALSHFVKTINEAQGDASPAPAGENGQNQIYRLLNFQNWPSEVWVLAMVANYVSVKLDELARKNSPSRTGQMKGSLDVLKAHADHKAGQLDKGFPSAYAASGNASGRASGYIDIREDQFEAASTYLTGYARVPSADRSEMSAFYACYRYSVGVGEISKNHFTIEPCTDSDPVCRFENSFKDRNGNSRHSSGVAFKEAGWVYLVGRIDGDNGIKAVAISALGRDRPALVQALVMSKVMEPLVSQAALERLQAPMPEQDIRVKDERIDPEFSSADFRNRIVPLIQNGVEFRSFDRIVYVSPDGREREVSQPQMVQMLPSLITGEFRLRNAAGVDRPFNPASHEHYPFNQAIRIREQ